METVAFFSAMPYDREWFDKLNIKYDMKYFEHKLTPDSAALAAGCRAVIAFVNDDLSGATIDQLYQLGVRFIALRCAGYNNVDLRRAYKKINVTRVPAYSPYSVAEHATALLLTLVRKTHKAYNRTRDFNFSLSGLTGFDLAGKSVGVIGTGKIGRLFIDICNGFKMNVLASDPFPANGLNAKYVELDELFANSDIISLHCPLSDSTKHIIDQNSIAKMKEGVIIVNTSRGELIESQALLKGLKEGKIGGAALDVYDEETDLFFEDNSGSIIKDDVLSLLVTLPNVLITSHQGFLTREALKGIAEETFKNLDEFFGNKMLSNEVCYRCKELNAAIECRKTLKQRCF